VASLRSIGIVLDRHDVRHDQNCLTIGSARLAVIDAFQD
jgi:hypothetical protein